MFSGIERHFSVVSLLLVAGAGLILIEGPVGAGFLRPVAKAIHNETPKVSAAHTNSDFRKQVAKAIHLDYPATTWADTANDATPLHTSVLGEIPLSAKADTAAK